MSDTDSRTKPVIVLVPGAWNTVGSFNLVVPILEAAGYLVRCVSLPSVGAEPPLDNIQPDVDAIRSVIQKDVDAAFDVLLLMHDYACVPGGEAVRGLDKITRLEDGQKGGVTCLFYAASPLLPPGACMAEIFEDRDDSWIVTSRDKKIAIPERPADVFCPEVETQLAKEYVASLKPHSYRTFLSRTTWEPYRNVPFYCLFCRLDKVLPFEQQKSLAAAIGVKFKSSTVNSGHCPFLGEPDEMVRAIRRAAKETTYYSGVATKDYGSPRALNKVEE